MEAIVHERRVRPSAATANTSSANNYDSTTANVCTATTIDTNTNHGDTVCSVLLPTTWAAPRENFQQRMRRVHCCKYVPVDDNH